MVVKITFSRFLAGIFSPVFFGLIVTTTFYTQLRIIAIGQRKTFLAGRMLSH